MPALSDVDERAEAIERAYRDRFTPFANALAAVAGSYEGGRDAVQEGFARALRQRARFRGEAPIEAWIFRIALRAALELRRDGRDVPLEDVLDPGLVEPERDPELAVALRSLPPRRRLIVFLRYFADLSYGEIAAVCDISEGTVAASLAQARSALLEAIQPDEVKT
jgi:RNA polymerase sigma-70 factor (ECF subfamily)